MYSAGSDIIEYLDHASFFSSRNVCHLHSALCSLCRMQCLVSSDVHVAELPSFLLVHILADFHTIYSPFLLPLAVVVMEYINLEKYPLHDEKLLQPVIQKLKETFRRDGSLLIPGFIREECIQTMAAEVVGLETHHRLEIVQPLFTDSSIDKALFDQKLPVSHPLKHRLAQDVHAVADDLIPKSAMLRQVYNLPLFLRFLAILVDRKEVYPFADEFQALNVMYIRDGGSRAWHYDGSDFVVTLMLQQAQVGGEFEYAPFIRGPEGHENFNQVQKLFCGSYAGTKMTKACAGDLALFNGRRSLHRVRTVYGARDRIMSVLSYARTPHEKGVPEKNVMLYGPRVAKLYEERGVQWKWTLYKSDAKAKL